MKPYRASYSTSQINALSTALDLFYRLLDNRRKESEIRKAYLRQSRHHYLIADHTKFSEKADIVTSSLDILDMVITVPKLSKAWKEKMLRTDS